MRFVLVSMLLISTSATAAAAQTSRVHRRHHEIVRPSEDAPVPPGWYKFPGYPPIPPSEDRNLDPSNFGSG